MRPMRFCSYLGEIDMGRSGASEEKCEDSGISPAPDREKREERQSDRNESDRDG